MANLFVKYKSSPGHPLLGTNDVSCASLHIYLLRLTALLRFKCKTSSRKQKCILIWWVDWNGIMTGIIMITYKLLGKLVCILI